MAAGERAMSSAVGGHLEGSVLAIKRCGGFLTATDQQNEV